MSRRSRAREIVLQVLFQDDLNSPSPDDVLNRFVRTRLKGDQHLIDFAKVLISGVRQYRDKIDEQLEITAENWRLSRMAATDRNILRLGSYEILYSDTPDRVAINEAIELAKRFGTANSAQFVNGILDRLMKQNDTTSAEAATGHQAGLTESVPETEDTENN